MCEETPQRGPIHVRAGQTAIVIAVGQSDPAVGALALDVRLAYHTLGKRLLSIAVISRGGARPQLGNILIRNLLRPWLPLVPLAYVVGSPVLFLTPGRRRVGEHIRSSARRLQCCASVDGRPTRGGRRRREAHVERVSTVASGSTSARCGVFSTRGGCQTRHDDGNRVAPEQVASWRRPVECLAAAFNGAAHQRRTRMGSLVRIPIADDDKTFLDSTVDLLERVGCECDRALDSWGAAEELSRHARP